MAKRTTAKPPEYRLLIAPHTSSRTYQPTTLFILETVQEFAAFRYELSVNERQEGKSIAFRILGLKAPSLNLPSAGRARFVKEYEDLSGTYTITVVGLDGNPSVCTVKIGKGRVTLVKPPSTAALIVATDRNKWKE